MVTSDIIFIFTAKENYKMNTAKIIYDTSDIKPVYKWIRDNLSYIGTKDALVMAKIGEINFECDETKAIKFFEYLKYENIKCRLIIDISYEPKYERFRGSGIAWAATIEYKK